MPIAPPDFASAAMLRVLAQGLRELGLEAPATPDGATVGLDAKRALLHHAIQQGGMRCLALLGRGLHRFTHDPTHRALATARDARDLFERWARLERYIHSRHRVQIVAVGVGEARLRHVSLRAQAPPHAAEDLVVLGVLVAFLEACGHTGLQAWAGAVRVYPACGDEAPGADSSEWRITWAAHAMPSRPAGADPGDLAPDEVWSGDVKALFNGLVARLPAAPAMDALARELGRARRSLQRELQLQGTGYRPLLAEARYRTAAWWLLQTDAALAEIGFLCGHADQSHFTREFRRRSGMTPADYRRHFAAAS
ncbi:helix-turn-helix transcriptional regulator [Roseateles asaccharophilus]|uniref:AraC-like DNA-binding protein n=1 Tax=Roseateles asaccharophilus TaxID=582607 RepID=A0ABU2A7G3_9BURK|nr:helix-turn-helix transcriptional regulator [Roseateles asaccharophilus]MDR7333137.1 AraC-like DNA-binding protein [Roseateles asaccharophilus]